jgi:hypothetical protein
LETGLGRKAEGEVGGRREWKNRRLQTCAGGVDTTHRVSLTLSVSEQVVTGKYTNSAGDTGIFSGSLMFPEHAESQGGSMRPERDSTHL